MSPLSYSVTPFSVTHMNQTVKVDLMVPPLVRPGDALAITYKTDHVGKIVVFAVDEGILQVARYEAPDPLKYFFQKRALEVNTLQILDQILPKFVADRELSAVGGDEGTSELAKNLNPFKRKTEAPVVYWSGIIDTDSAAHQLTYQLPDYFNGMLRVMAVAVATDAVGAATQTTDVRGDFVINPNAPTFVAPGDEFEITTSVANNVEHSGDHADITVQLSTSPHLKVRGSGEEHVVIPEGQERSVTFKVKANALLGSAELKFVAKMGDKSSKMTATLSVRPAMPYSAFLTTGYSNEDKTLKLDHPFYPEFRKVEAVASSSPLILITGLQRYLDDYPYGCVEQLVSKALPWLVMSNQPWFKADAATLQDKVQKTIQMLIQRQMTNGGFSYWPDTGSTNSDVFASIYAMHFLTEAKLRGFNVPANVYAAGIGYLKEVAAKEVTNLNEARLTAYAIYILTRNEIVTSNYLSNLQLTLNQHKEMKWNMDITGAYMAATYQLLKSSTEAVKLMDAFQLRAQQSEDDNDFYNQNIANAQYLYLVALHFSDRLQHIESVVLDNLVNALNESSISTVLSGYTCLALSAYDQNAQTPSEEQISISETLEDGKENLIASSGTGYQKVSLAADAVQVNIKNPSKLGYFYQLVQAGFEKNLPKKAVNEGVEVFREFTNADNTVVNNAKLGEEITVHIRARATDKQYHTNMALVDLLPGGFDVVRSSVTLQNMDYVDAREDRVIFFGDIGPESKDITYRIKASNSGSYVVPPMFGKSMYNPMVKSIGAAGSIRVKD